MLLSVSIGKHVVLFHNPAAFACITSARARPVHVSAQLSHACHIISPFRPSSPPRPGPPPNPQVTVAEVDSHKLFRLASDSKALVVLVIEGEEGELPAPFQLAAALKGKKAWDDM